MENGKKGISKKKMKEIEEFIKNKKDLFKSILQKLMITLNDNKSLDLISSSNLTGINDIIETLFIKLNTIENNITIHNYNNYLTILQVINNDLSSLFKKYGCSNFMDFILICLDKKNLSNSILEDKNGYLKLLLNFFQPISYKSILWKNIPNELDEKSTLVEDFSLAKYSNNFQCYALNNINNFKLDCQGIKVIIHNKDQETSLIVTGIINEISKECIDSAFITEKINALKENKNDEIEEDILNRYIKSLTLKDLLIYTKLELINTLHNNINSIKTLRIKPIMPIVKQFMKSSLIEKRRMLILLLIFKHESDFEYISYLLYDLLSNDSNNTIDTREQMLLYDSLPVSFKKYFKEAMTNTLSYTADLYHLSNNIPLEQQICLLKVNDVVKEKAMVKLKEIKSKSDDSGSKARQYLEGLLRIPFQQFTKEPIMYCVPDTIKIVNKIIELLPDDLNSELSPVSTFMDIQKNMTNIQSIYQLMNHYYYEYIMTCLSNGKKYNLVKNIRLINQFNKKNDKDKQKISVSGKSMDHLQNTIQEQLAIINKDSSQWLDFFSYINNEKFKHVSFISEALENVTTNCKTIQHYMKTVNDTLDKSVYGHSEAKKQIKRIIGQWITGENSGYCFGFEGPPGVGKTSLAKLGIADCLCDEEGKKRPFSFIAVGGSSNGSTFEGHNYTYVGSTWGKIVDILMESKCMNPIIFIDELDKISKTENGKELIGILTHLIDSTQNDKFQDKYFSGIDLDLSKILFIFSYNDASIIDRILLDRIHRVKFERLTIIDKIEIPKRHLLKEVSKKLGMVDQITMDDETIRFIINTYTNESGVRKLKEILFEIYSEINLEILDNSYSGEYPMELTKEIIENKYLSDRYKSKPQKIHTENSVGLINGLWANSLGMGGILSIESSFIDSSNFLDLKLTGMQGDVMKESMNVSKTMAWNLLTPSQQKKARETLEKNKQQGIHIHCPDGATSKDGPSAGTAITMVIYSLLTHQKIKNNIAITGEINLQGKVTAIGGLDLKIIGGIEAGVTEFIYPDENHEDFEKFLIKYEKRKDILNGIKFHKVQKVQDVMKIIFTK